MQIYCIYHNKSIYNYENLLDFKFQITWYLNHFRVILSLFTKWFNQKELNKLNNDYI